MMIYLVKNLQLNVILLAILSVSNLYSQQLSVEGDIDLQNHQVTNLADPIDNLDAVSKTYADSIIIQLGSQLVGLTALLNAGYTVQEMLDAGIEPLALIYEKIEKDSLYGKYYQGGLIFYLDDQDTLTGIKGMVAAEIDQVNATWGCDGIAINGANGVKIGTGQQNTQDIVSDCHQPAIAARRCEDLVLHGYADWFLPSLQELSAMYWQIGPGAIGANENIGNFPVDYYWSSTEYGNPIHFAEALYFSGGVLWTSSKTVSRRVRAVRSF